jgi:SPP1 family predicted phage head-tail adaptor
MRAGDLDRRVTILARVETIDAAYGTKTVTWSSDPDAGAVTVWAQVRDVLPSRADRMANEIALANRPARVRMRYRDDVDLEDRLQIDGRQMRVIAGPAEIGRREGIEVMVEELTTEGQQT